MLKGIPESLWEMNGGGGYCPIHSTLGLLWRALGTQSPTEDPLGLIWLRLSIDRNGRPNECNSDTTGQEKLTRARWRLDINTAPCHGVLWRLDISAPYHIIPWCGIPYNSTVHHTMDHVPWCGIPQHTTTWSQQQPHPQLDQPSLWSCHELHLVEAITLQICRKKYKYK